MPYTTHPFYTVTYNQPDGSAREGGVGAGGASTALALCLRLSSAIISDLRLANWLKMTLCF